MAFEPWLIGGIVFAVLEMALPGGWSGAVGGATLLIALLAYCGWLTSYPMAFGLWLALSTLTLIVVWRVMRRLSPNQTSVGSSDYDDAWLGTDAPVTETILPGTAGRVLVGGTSWLAVLDDPAATALPGERVRLLMKTNITWTVASIPNISSGDPS